jgi:hypothetical protein
MKILRFVLVALFALGVGVGAGRLIWQRSETPPPPPPPCGNSVTVLESHSELSVLDSEGHLIRPYTVTCRSDQLSFVSYDGKAGGGIIVECRCILPGLVDGGDRGPDGERR